MSADDVVLVLSNSGETEEIVRLLPWMRSINLPVIAVTSGEPAGIGPDICLRLAERGYVTVSPRNVLWDYRGRPHPGADFAEFEVLTKEEALQALREHEREGLCHTVWTFHTPFIGGLCNCDRSDCIAMKATVTHDFPVMFRAEYVAKNGVRLVRTPAARWAMFLNWKMRKAAGL